MATGCESSRKLLEAQVISSSLDGWTVSRRPARWSGWSSALITLLSAYYFHIPPFPMLFVYRNEPGAAVAAACYIRQ